MNDEELRQGLRDKLTEAYEYYLMENFADEIHCKDDLIEAVETLKHYEDFIEYLKEEGVL